MTVSLKSDCCEKQLFKIRSTFYFFLTSQNVKSTQHKYIRRSQTAKKTHHRPKMFWFTVPVQSVPITTKDASSNPVHGEVYSIQHYVIKIVSDL